MALERHRANYIGSILRALLVANILVFILSAVGMFLTSSARGVYIFGIISCSCLVASVGFQLLSRWQRLGLYVVVGFYVCAASILYLLFPSELNSVCGAYGSYILFAIIDFIFLSLIILIFTIKDKKVGRNCWSQMSGGADVKHFRHIYQLTSVLLLIVGGLMLFLPATKTLHYSSNTSKEKPILADREISYELLDSANVTLDEIISIESMIDSIPVDLQLKYNKRIFALKHLLLSGIMTKEHDAKDIINISKVHLGEFSESQQQILDWYLGLSTETQQRWMDCPPVNNLRDFKQKLTETIENR